MKKQERINIQKLFKKHINLSGTDLRTVTFGQMIVQVLQRSSLESGDNIHRLGKISLKGINGKEIRRSEITYEKFIKEELGLELGKLCPCPGNPRKYCNWGEKMFQKIIVDTKCFNVISIQIVDVEENEILATSTQNAIEQIGNYSVVKMKTLSDLAKLPAGKIIRTELQWIPAKSSEILSVGLYNEIPAPKITKEINLEDLRQVTK